MPRGTEKENGGQEKIEKRRKRKYAKKSETNLGEERKKKRDRKKKKKAEVREGSGVALLGPRVGEYLQKKKSMLIQEGRSRIVMQKLLRKKKNGG